MSVRVDLRQYFVPADLLESERGMVYGQKVVRDDEEIVVQSYYLPFNVDATTSSYPEVLGVKQFNLAFTEVTEIVSTC